MTSGAQRLIVSTLSAARSGQAFGVPRSRNEPRTLKLITLTSMWCPLATVGVQGDCTPGWWIAGGLYLAHDRGEYRGSGGGATRRPGRTPRGLLAYGRGLARAVVHGRLDLPPQARRRRRRALGGGREARARRGARPRLPRNPPRHRHEPRRPGDRTRARPRPLRDAAGCGRRPGREAVHRRAGDDTGRAQRHRRVARARLRG